MRPIVAVVGRPNVGKSTFFNFIAGKRISIVEDTPGVTRDRIYAECEWRNKKFTMIDTGGIEPESEDIIFSQMRKQSLLAMEMADVIIFMVNIKDGVLPADLEIANMLRRSKKPVILVCNKVDNVGNPPDDIYEFYNIGLGEPYPVSSLHALGIGDILDKVYEYFPEDDEESDEYNIKVAVVGKPNVGKSSLINKILNEDRLIVSDIAGTTRDAVDTEVVHDGQKYIFIDTAGIRKRNKIEDEIEKFSVLRSFTAVERADVCLIMIDATEGVTEQDTKVAGYAHEQGKACIIIVNKWDLVDKQTGTLEEYKKTIYEGLAYMQYAPVLFISAKTGQRIENIYELIKYVADQNSARITTGMLNSTISEAVAMNQPPSDKGRPLKIYYATQVAVKPPTFAIFVNSAKMMHISYRRYLENQLRKNFGFEGTPIRFVIREKKQDD